MTGFHDRRGGARLFGCGCAGPAMERQRAKLCALAQGVVLELGFGAGKNLAYLTPDRVRRVIAVEPSAGLLARARRAAEGAGVPVEVVAERAERLALPAASVDTVLVTFALCAIHDPAAALAAAARALKPGGRVLFCEHGLAPEARVRRMQRRIEPVWRGLAGCRLTRDVPRVVEAGGLRIERLQAHYLPNTPQFAGYVYVGAARPR